MNQHFINTRKLKRVSSLRHIMLIALFIILIHRFTLLFFSHSYWKIFDVKLYSFFLGILLLSFSYLFYIFYEIKKYYLIFIFLFSVGLALVLDQAIFLIVQERTGQGYWSFISIAGTIASTFFILCYIFVLRRIKGTPLVISKPVITSRQTSVFFISYTIGAFLPRIIVLLFPGKSIIIFGFEIHHLYTGLLLFIVSGFYILCSISTIDKLTNRYTALNHLFILLKRNHFVKILLQILKYSSIIVNGFGLGLIFDQYIFLLKGGVTDYDYWRFSSVLGLFIFWALGAIIIFGAFLKQKRMLKLTLRV